MTIKEQEIRTKELNLLMCKMKLTEKGQLDFELKNGKRVERISLETFIENVNEFTEGCAPELHISMK